MHAPAHFVCPCTARAESQLCFKAPRQQQPLYLCLQGSFYNLTIMWLIRHNFPPGPIHLTRTHMPTLPVFASVGNFKVQYMEELKSKGFELYAAYGNTGTDVRAYEAAGIPKERCAAARPRFALQLIWHDRNSTCAAHAARSRLAKRRARAAPRR